MDTQLLRGYNSHMRLVAPVDAIGQLNFDNVIPDTYQLTLNDLENPNVVSASAIILAGSTSASVSITYALSNALNKTGLKSMSASFVASQLTQDGKAPAERTVATKRAKACTSVGAGQRRADVQRHSRRAQCHHHLADFV